MGRECCCYLEERGRSGCQETNCFVGDLFIFTDLLVCLEIPQFNRVGGLSSADRPDVINRKGSSHNAVRKLTLVHSSLRILMGNIGTSTFCSSPSRCASHDRKQRKHKAGGIQNNASDLTLAVNHLGLWLDARNKEEKLWLAFWEAGFIAGKGVLAKFALARLKKWKETWKILEFWGYLLCHRLSFPVQRSHYKFFFW